MAVPMLSDSTRSVTGGVDTHKHVHVAAVVNWIGAELGTASFATTTVGYEELLDWMRNHGEVARVGVEGPGSWGVEVVEINRPNRQDRRRTGKSDAIDATAAARAALAGLDAGIPKAGDGPIESIRMVRLARRSAVTTRTRTMNQIRAVIDTASDDVRDRYRHLTPMALIKAITGTRPGPNIGDPAVAAVSTLRILGRRWRFMNDQTAELDTQLETLVRSTAPNLLAIHCVGVETAATLLVTAGDNPGRLTSEAAFAAVCGVNPRPAGSGKTNGRHRLNRAGDRNANNALWRIVMARMSHDERTRTYVQRRTTEGLSKREIIRCLKRYVAREIYPILIGDLTS